VLAGHDDEEVFTGFVPVRQNALGYGAAGEVPVSAQEHFELALVRSPGHCVYLHHSRVYPVAAFAGRVPDVGDSSAHSGREVIAYGAEYGDFSAGHVRTGMVAHALNDVACGEPLADFRPSVGGRVIDLGD